MDSRTCREAELALVSSGIDFTIIRPGGMERPTVRPAVAAAITPPTQDQGHSPLSIAQCAQLTLYIYIYIYVRSVHATRAVHLHPQDDFKETHSTRLYSPDTKFSGLISRLQIAELCVEAAFDTAPASSSRNKIVEAIAEEGKPATALASLFDGVAAIPGKIEPDTLEFYTRKYDYATADAKTRTMLTTFLESMSFSGSIPELLNGRLAMLGFIEALEAEMLGKGTVMEQLQLTCTADVAYDVVVLAIIALVVVGTIVPLSKRNLRPADANWGPFTAFTEMLHGRLAMIGFVGLMWMENAYGTPLLHMLNK